ncbi:unnamed protein product, partial [Medioppia subpectinata]
ISGADTQESGFKCPEKFGHYPDGQDCQKYYVCDHGRTLEQRCDDGLLYNTYLKTCDWPRNVQCDRGGKRVNTRRNPDIQKNAYSRDFDETNRLNDENNRDNDDPSGDSGRDYNQKFQSGSVGAPKQDSPQWNPNFASITGGNRRTVSRGPVSRAPANTEHNANPGARPPPPPPEYEYDVPDYYEYEQELNPQPKPVVRRKPVKEAAPPPRRVVNSAPGDRSKAPSVKRMGWLPGDSDSREMNEYHWSPKDGAEYSKDVPKLPDEAFIKADTDFRNPEKQLREDNSPNTGPEPKDDEEDEREEYDDYYEDDEEAAHPHTDEDLVDDTPHHHHHEDDHHHHHDDDGEQPAETPTQLPPPNSPNKVVTYDDDDEVRAQPKVQPPRAPTDEWPKWNSRAPYIANSPQYARLQGSANPSAAPDGQNLGNDEFEKGPRAEAVVRHDRPVAKTYIPNTTNYKKFKPIKTNIHYKNNNSPYLKSVVDSKSTASDGTDGKPKATYGAVSTGSGKSNNNYVNNSKNDQKVGTLVQSTPRNAVKKKIVIKKFVSHKNKPKKAGQGGQGGVQSSESDSPSIYQVMDDFRDDVPNTILRQKSLAQDFRDSIIDNYMNNDKPNYILNDNDFDGKTYKVKVLGEEGDSDGELVRDFEQDFGTGSDHDKNSDQNEKHKSNSDHKSVHFMASSDRDKSDNDGKSVDKQPVLNTDAIVKNQRDHNNNNNKMVNAFTETPIFVGNKQPADNKWYKNQTYSRPKVIITDYKPPPKRTAPGGVFGWKQSVVFAPLPPPPPQVVVPTTTSTASPPKWPFVAPPPIPTTTTTTTTTKPRIRIKGTAKANKPVMKAPKQQAAPKTVAPNGQWYQNVKYEANPSVQTASYAKADKCNPQHCRTPDCRCGGTDIPGGLPLKQTPQIVVLTFDDSVNDLNWDIYDELFNSDRNNPNGCPVLATFYVSHEWTDYSQVQTLYARGHEMASHSVT